MGKDLEGRLSLSIKQTREYDEVLPRCPQLVRSLLPSDVAGRAEQDPAFWTAAVWNTVREVLPARGGRELAGIGVSGQQHGLVPIDRHGVPVRPAKVRCRPPST